MANFATRLDSHSIQFARLLPGPIERVWDYDYIYDGKKRGEWFASGDMPAQVGNSFAMRFKHSEYSPNISEPPERMREIDCSGHNSANRLLACEPPHRLAFTFGAEKNSGEVSEVEFRLEAQGDKVRLTLTHTKIPDRDYMLGVSGGWHSHLDVLEYALKSEVPPGFWDVWRRYEGVYDKHYD